MAISGTYRTNEPADGDDREELSLSRPALDKEGLGGQKSSKTKTTTTTTTTTIYTTKESAAEASKEPSGEKNEKTTISSDTLDVAAVEDLGRQAAVNSPVSIRRNLANLNGPTRGPIKRDTSHETTTTTGLRDERVEGNKRVTTIATLAAQSGHTRIVLALLKDGQSIQLKIQEMRPGMFEVGSNHKECLKYVEEHEKLIRNLRKQKQTPIECWMRKFEKIRQTKEPNMSTERKLVYMCMAENLQGCWKALLNQLDERRRLLEMACGFYESCEHLVEALDISDNYVQQFRQEFLNGSNSAKFEQACNDLKGLNEQVLSRYQLARIKQQKLVDLISVIGTGNLADARVNYLISDAQTLINYIKTYLDPLERRKLQLESVITTSRATTTTTTTSNQGGNNKLQNRYKREQSIYTDQSSVNGSGKSYPLKSNIAREISNFNDLMLVDNWLNVKIEQLNSTLLSSLGVSVPDSRSILSKHEQILLECRAIEEATLTFNGRNIHAVKSLEAKDDKFSGDKSLFEQQKQLAIRARDVITILDVRIILLRRTIDFYLRSQEATGDIGKMMRRLQVDNSLQSVQFVANELELKDVSSVVASGATIISELQQLQLAQQHGQRSRIVNLNLVTTGIRSIIDQLNQELAHLKTVLNQRKLILLNEDANKMANNFSNKCHQLHFWLNNHVKSYLLANNRLSLESQQMRQFCDNHEQLRTSVQNKTLEVEALLRSLPTVTEHFDTKSKLADEIQKATDELRQDWINTTNCLDKRIELGRKYLAILGTMNTLDKELNWLDNFNKGQLTRPERTEEDIKSNVDQSHVQLSNQVKNFNVDAERNNTGLVFVSDNQQLVNDINKQELVENANNLLEQLSQRKEALAKDSLLQRTPKKKLDPAHQRPQQVDPPRFTRVLSDKSVEPFSTVELECETDDANCQIEWFMNNYKKIPASIKHSSLSENNQHKLTICNFGPICCGTYIVKASNSAGQATSQCKLRLSGIKEANDEQQARGGSELVRQNTTLLQEPNFHSSSPAISTTSSFSHWRPSSNEKEKTINKTITRIIEGVGSSERESSPTQSNQQTGTRTISQSMGESDTDTDIATTTTTTINTTMTTSGQERTPNEFPVTQVSYSGQPSKGKQEKSNHLRVANTGTNYTVESPVSSTTLESRSISRSPFEGTPQPPIFVQGLSQADSMSRCCSRSGLVCLVVGNPPPTIEWLHNDKSIAKTKCPKTNTCPRGSFCKLTIETGNNNKNQGEYICKASNRLGQASTGITLTK